MSLSHFPSLSTLIMGVILAITGPSRAQDTYQQFTAAREIFGPQMNLQMAESSETLFRGLEGDWFPIGAFDPEEEDLPIAMRTCEGTYTKIRVLTLWSFERLRMNRDKVEMTTLFTQQRGRFFSSYTDPTEMADLSGIDMLNDMDRRAMVLRNLNGGHFVIQPSADIAVFISDGRPDYYARCPS